MIDIRNFIHNEAVSNSEMLLARSVHLCEFYGRETQWNQIVFMINMCLLCCFRLLGRKSMCIKTKQFLFTIFTIYNYGYNQAP